MNLTVTDLSNVDREVVLTAGADVLAPRIDAALRKIRQKAALPGFRPGVAPLELVRKRFGKDVEFDEINAYVQEVFRDEIFPAHNPVGDPKITKMHYEDGKLEVVFHIGIRPQFDVADLATVKVDKLTHDVTEAEIDQEIEHSRRRKGTWTETDGPATADCKVIVDAVPVDHDGHLHMADMDMDKELDLASKENEGVVPQLVGAKKGDTRRVSFAHGDHAHDFDVTVKSVKTVTLPELDEAFIKEATQDEASDLEGYRAHLRSRIQDYFDRASDDLFKERIADALVAAHTFDVPETVIDAVTNGYIEDVKQRNNGEMPGFDLDQYREAVRPRAVNEAKWMFILEKMEERWPELELTKEDIDGYLATEAARYGLPVDMIKQYYASSTEQMEQLRRTLRSQKLFARLSGEVGVNPVSKEEYQQKYA